MAKKNKSRVHLQSRQVLQPVDHTGTWGLGNTDDDNDIEQVHQQRPQVQEPDTIYPIYQQAIARAVLDMDDEDDQPELHFQDADDDIDMSDWEED
jgi:hypothetical protein